MLIFLTGASGLAGAAVVETASRRGHHVIGTAFRSEPPSEGLKQLLRLDLGETYQVARTVLDAFPDVIINAAAVSEAAKCEEDPAASARINVELPAALARLAHHISARFIHLSSDMVFDGLSSQYSPSAPANPSSEYGRQKLEAEKRVLAEASGTATIVRTTLLTGNSPGGRRSLHEKLFEMWADGRAARLFTDELRQPCLVNNLAEVVVELCERNDLRGTFHWAGPETISRYEIGRRILEHFKLPPGLVEKASLAGNPQFAGRPPRLTLDISHLAGKLKTRPVGFEEQLEHFKVPPPFRAWYNSL
jgi:dTDP-4-dehydrorhamnose reductase